MNDWETRREQRWERRHERLARRGHSPYTGLFVGLLMIGGGVLFLLRNLGIVYFDNIGDYWPVILIVIGGSKLISPRGMHDVSSGMIVGGIGVLFLLRNLGIIYGNFWGFVWPAALIGIGATMLMKHLNGPDWWTGGGTNPPSPAAGPASVPGTGENSLFAETVFGGIERNIVSQAFEGGKVSVVFGGAEIDLRGAAMQGPEIVLKADAVFGGIDLKVPDTWQVDVRGSGVFGSYENHTHAPAAANAPKLIVKGGAVFGGVTVRN
jgi:predicted membrane protein